MEMEEGSAAQIGGCWVFLPRRLFFSRLGYRQLALDAYDDHHDHLYSSSSSSAVTVVVGKERRVFAVEPFVLEEEPFRALMGMTGNKKANSSYHRQELQRGRSRRGGGIVGKDVIFVDVDSILFEHLLWLVDQQDGCHSLLHLNLKEIIEFYAQD